MKKPFFSIVIPVYNAEKTIIATLESLNVQTFNNFEVILVNDGSVDESKEIINSFITDKPHFCIINTKNGGPGSARNIGIDHSNGEYLIFADADDILKNNTLQERYNLLQQSQPDLLITSYSIKILDDGDIVSEKTTSVSDNVYEDNESFIDSLFSLMEKQLMYVVWNKVYRLDIVKKQHIRFPNYKSCEDRLFNLAFFDQVQKVVTTETVLYDYFFEGKQSLTNKFFDNKFSTFVEFYLACIKLAPKDIDGFSALFLKGVLSSIIPVHSINGKSFKEKNNYIKNILHNEYVVQAAKTSKKNTLIRKVLAFAFNMRSSLVMYLLSYILYSVSNLSPKMIEKLKGNF
ncbi:glycosyl transferase [Marinilactibacillus psychrotolerans]|uniref:glycosyltransferase family 2 protein n=1 Tax=Marinilactibacillus psychrotolerans TaxID=191770 RepID=UPI001C7D04DD|nr:glycosyltransferase [Marinilactibacillus psychrotolerans]GEQ32287.1 glycosyl transferase [Marinilactibacillus psychrotolerans]